ncbi:MAG: cobalt-precorrin-5B (C(1))-methyltransferase [Rhodospirillum sp.]|nr:cobalt-precorrin-5B (C(1))-methyltransferase [Rhodospirillum sp.]MCF8491658.1 cobalt-precorrin-5B (C(1))-methyltransferase [Rhodospirillum sp.]MCF8501364.1 cobalt-precorrin-5B (C(1))-methyltransferase [Rhodospirillum sp.]
MEKTTLRSGWTTGACATAAARAAFRALVTGQFPDPVTIALPRGKAPSFPLARAELANGTATVGIIKDAGDDPDVTHGLEIQATLRLLQGGNGLLFRAGEGVGTITKPGLPLPPGEPAINPGPRAQITANIQTEAASLGVGPDAEVTLSIPGGAEVAKGTLNPRLGIVGGLSVLGTTGVVVPFSCAAWIHSIHRGIDVARALGLDHLAGSTGRTSETAVQRLFSLPEDALIDMGDFAGAVLKYLRRHPVPRFTLAGGFGKLTKLAQGHLDLHSSRSTVDMTALASALKDLGAPDHAVREAERGATSAVALAVADREGIDLAGLIARRARAASLACVGGDMEIHVIAFGRDGTLLARTDRP